MQEVHLWTGSTAGDGPEALLKPRILLSLPACTYETLPGGTTGLHVCSYRNPFLLIISGDQQLDSLVEAVSTHCCVMACGRGALVGVLAGCCCCCSSASFGWKAFRLLGFCGCSIHDIGDAAAEGRLMETVNMS